MRAVSVFPLDEFRLALKKVYGAAAPKGPFTALSQATLFSAVTPVPLPAAISTNGVRRRSRHRAMNFPSPYMIRKDFWMPALIFLVSFIWNMKLPRKSRTTVTSPTTRRVFPVEGVRSISWYSTAISIRCRKSFNRSRSIRSTLELFSASSHRSGTLFPRTQTAPGAAAYNLRITGCTRWTDIG